MDGYLNKWMGVGGRQIENVNNRKYSKILIILLINVTFVCSFVGGKL